MRTLAKWLGILALCGLSLLAVTFLQNLFAGYQGSALHTNVKDWFDEHESVVVIALLVLMAGVMIIGLGQIGSSDKKRRDEDRRNEPGGGDSGPKTWNDW